jgi:hypothetical protein
VQFLSTKIDIWLRKHRRSLPYVGSVVVIFTFIIKEGLSERWRHTAETIDMADYVYSIRIDTRNAISQLQALSKEVDPLAHPPEKQAGPTNAGFVHDSESLFREAESIEATISNVDILLEKLPHEKTLQERMHALKKNLEDRRQEISDVDPKEPASNARGQTNTSTNDQEVDDIRNVFGTVERFVSVKIKLQHLYIDLIEFNDAVLQKARLLKKQNEVRSTYAWWASAAFTLLGIGVGLLGKIYGESEIEGIEPVG